METNLGYVGLVILLFSIILILFVGARAWKKGSDKAGCIINIRNVQQAVRSHQGMTSLNVGDPIDWKVIFGPSGFLSEPTCPLGGTYTYTNIIPPDGTLVVTCSHADHVPASHADW